MEYSADALVRKVNESGRINFRGHSLRIGRGLTGERVALRATDADGIWSVYYGAQRVWAVSLRVPP